MWLHRQPFRMKGEDVMLWDGIIDYLPLVAGSLVALAQTYQKTNDFRKSHGKIGSLLIAVVYFSVAVSLGALIYQTHKKRVQSYVDKQNGQAFEQRATKAERNLDEATRSLRDLKIQIDMLPKS